MAKGIRFYEPGGPEVLRWESLPVGDPGPGEVRVRHVAVGLNFADTYFRSGLYPAALPAGMGVEAAGVIEAVGPGVTGFAAGDRVTYTGSPLGAYSTERVMDATHLIKLPDAIPFETAAAMTMRGLTCAYLLRRIADLTPGDTVLLHAAAGGVGLIFCQWAQPARRRVIGTVSTDEKARSPGPTAARETIVYPREDVATRVRELTDGAGVPVVYDSIGTDTFAVVARLAEPARPARLLRHGVRPHPADRRDAAGRQGLAVRHPSRTRRLHRRPAERAALAGELFDHVAAGRITVEINQRYALEDAVQAHRDLEAGRSVGSSVFSWRRRAPDPTPPHHHRGVPHALPRRPDRSGPVPLVHGRNPRDRGRSAHRHDRGRAARRQPRRGRPGRRRCSPSSRRCCCSTRCCSSATRTSPAPSTSRSPSDSARSRTTPSRAATPTTRAWSASTRTSTARPSTTRTPSTATRPGGRSRPMGSVLRCVESPARRRRHDLGRTWPRRTGGCPSTSRPRSTGLRARHSIEASFGAAMPAEQRRGLHARFPDAEHPVVRTHPETGEKVLFVNAFTTHFVNFHTPENVRFGFDYSPGASELLNYLIRQASSPSTRCAGAGRRTASPSGTTAATQHYAVQDYWPAVRKMERAGIVGTPTF